MKILLVQSWLGPNQDYPVYPLGLAYLGTALRNAGREVRIFDPNVSGAPLEELKAKIRRFGPDVIGLSLRNLDNQVRIDFVYYYNFFQELLATAWQSAPDALRIVGGAGFSMFAKQIMQDNPAIDMGVFLEAEDSFPQLLNNLSAPEQVKGVYYRRDGEIRFTGEAPVPDFAALPYPQRDFNDLTQYKKHFSAFGVQTKRGCPLRCAYCNYPFLSGKRWRMRSPEHIGEELEYLQSLGVSSFVFADSIVNLPYDYSAAIFNEMISRKVNLEWVGYMHLQGMTKEYMLLAKKAGCKVMVFSPDAVSAQALQALQKDIDPEEVKRIYALACKDPDLRDIYFHFSFFINPPGETFSGLAKTLWRYAEAKRRVFNRRIIVFINWIRVEPHSEVYKTALEQGVFTEQTNLLPASADQASQCFYSNPSLRFMDGPIQSLLKTPGRLKSVLRKIKPAPPGA